VSTALFKTQDKNCQRFSKRNLFPTQWTNYEFAYSFNNKSCT